jgi:exonuclease VII small subunit
MVANIGLSVALASALGLLLLLKLFSDGTASSYGQIVDVLGSTRHNLGPAIAVLGLVLVGFAGIVVWLFSLYASFRVAGPLYRMARDLEIQIEHGLATPVPIRATDQLQGEFKAFEACVVALQAQHEALKQASNELEDAIRIYTETQDLAALTAAFARLRQIEQRVRL